MDNVWPCFKLIVSMMSFAVAFASNEHLLLISKVSHYFLVFMYLKETFGTIVQFLSTYLHLSISLHVQYGYDEKRKKKMPKY